MKSSEEPKIATWLFESFSGNKELAGDLIEEYRGGRSAAWYWRQVLLAVAVGLRQEILGHKLLTTKAVVTGSTALYVLHAVSGRHNGAWKILIQLDRPLVRGPYSAPGIFDWVMPLQIFIIFAVAAWVVGRLNQRYNRSLLFIVLIFWSSWFWWSTSSYWLMLVVDSIHQSNFRPYLGNFLMRYSVAALGSWIGGWLSGHSPSDRDAKFVQQTN
jgi:hypothetical protein